MIVETGNLNFSYGSHPILKDLSFRLEGGQLVALLGENGSGKSTLLSCLAGLRDTSAVSWNGSPVAGYSRGQQAQNRAMVPQHPRYDPNMIVYDFILMGRKPHFRWRERDEDHEMTADMLKQFGLENLAFRTMSDISGGERQKAVLARAFVQDTPLLLLDEPLNNLDLRFQIDFMNILQDRARRSGTLVIAALHDINAALSWCDSALLLKEGRLIASGGTEESITEASLEKMLNVKTTFTQIGSHRQMVLPGAVVIN